MKSSRIINPWEVMMTPKLSTLDSAKRDLLLRKLAERRAGGPARTGALTITPGPTGEPAPLSHPQQRMWLVEQLAPGLPTYNVPTTLRLRGKLDIDALGNTLRALLARHTVLRTVVSDDGDEPVQRVLDAGDVPLPVVDVAGSVELAMRLAVAEARRPFNLRTGPLLRAKLFRVDEDDHLLVLTMHHIASDGWSATVLLRDLGELYSAAAGARGADLPDLPVTYADFTRWQRESVGGDQDLDYWTGELAGEQQLVSFPTDRPRPRVQDPAGGLVQRRLGPELSAGLTELAARENATLFMVLGAGLHALLHRYTGISHILTGFPIANRELPEIENLLGCFINTLVLHSDCSGDPSFRSLLGQVRGKALDAFGHQNLPFERLVEALRVPRDTSRTPLVQVMLAVQNATETTGLRFDGLAADVVDLETGSTRFDVSLVVTTDADGIELSWEYASSLYDDATVQRFATQLENLLRDAVADPDRSLSALAMLGPAEIEQLVSGDAAVAPVLTGCLPELFTARAEATPDAVALSFEGATLTYGQLLARARSLAMRLRARGVGPDALVGLSADRGMDMVIGLLGILLAGGAYVPLDPTYPPERLSFMLADTGAPVVVSTPSVAGGLPVDAGAVEFVDGPGGTDEWVESAVLPGNLAYAIYTSGSTGAPKGVLVAHANATAFIGEMIRVMAVTPRDRIVQYSSLNYDVSVFDVFTALLSGARLCLVGAEVRISPAKLTELLRDQRITIADLPPAVLTSLDPADVPDLRLLFVGGEAYSGELVNRWLGMTRRFVNGYGPTEVTVAPVLHDCAGSYRQSPPIGRPINGHRAYVLDSYGGLTPIGAAGELYLGGVGVTRGYLNQPGRTADRFVPDPFGTEPGARLYRTGDLVQYLPNTDIQFLGRVDDQIQLRGVRIEPGEIESLLQRHPDISGAVVVRREDPSPRLVAYVVPVGETPSAAELRELLAAELPPAMVPATFVPIAELPLMPSGKVDKAALPAPETALEREHVAPRTAAETVLAEKIFAEVLGLTDVGVTDNFFEIGGNSLQATQIVARMRDVFNVEVPLQAVFEKPTIADLAGLAAAAAPVAESTKDEVDDMSDDAVDELLGAMLTEQEGRDDA
ncbi:MAG TPA: amino acid adenylation domain-containing protein [Pseudonocardiaceae bacterium]